MRTARPWALPQLPTRRSELGPTVTPRMLRTQLAAGRLVRLRSQVYLDVGRWPDDPAGRHLMLARAEVAVYPDAVLSHQSAALVWGLPSPGWTPWEALPPSVTLPSGGSRRSVDGPCRHRTAALPRHHVARDAAGYLVTSPVRTSVDLAAGLDLPEQLVLFDATARLLVEAMVARPRRSEYAAQRFADAARQQLAEAAVAIRRTGLRPSISLADPRRESPIESLSAGHMVLSGIPLPVFQHPFRTRLGTMYADCYWPDHGLIGEADGVVKYSEPNAFEQEKRREQVLRDLGLRMVRWLGREVMSEPQTVMARIHRALAD